MDALLICAEEIALEGLDGCPVVHLWNNLEKLETPFPLKLDDSAKNYLWTGIVEALDISFYLLEQPLPRIFSSIEDKNLQKFLDTYKKLDLDELNIDVTMSYYRLVNEGKIRGSCPEYATRKDMTSEIRSPTGQCFVSLKDAQERWGDRLVMVASQDMRTKVLFPEDVDPNVGLSDIEYCILEHVGQARSKGRLQRCINIYLQIDSKTTFHFLKKMSMIGLVTKQQFVAHNTFSTNICSNIIKLKRFHSLHHHKYDILAHQLCQKLLEQPDHTMAMKDLRQVFEEGGTRERIFKRIRQDLQTSGHLQVVMKRVPSQAKTNKTRPTKGNLRHYVKLLKPFILPDVNQDDKVDDDDGEEEDDDDDDNVQLCGTYGNPNVVIEFSLLKQMYDFIESQAEHGIPNTDIDKALKISHYERRALVRTLEKSGHIKPVLTYGGRQSFLRYVATPYVEASSHLNKLLEEGKKFDAMKTVAVADTSTSSMETPSQTPLDSPCPSPSQSIQSTETMEVKEVVITGERKPKNKSVLAGKVTYRTLKRNNYVIDYLKKHKVVKGFHTILKAIQEAEEKEGLESKMDRVCLKKLLAKLLDDGLIKRMATVITINDTSHNVELYLDRSVNPRDSVVQVAIDQCRFQLYGEANKSKASSRKRVKTDTDTDEHKLEDEGEDEDDINPDKIIADHSLRYKYGYLAKFPRMRLFHEYLWQLLFGIKEANQNQPSVVKSKLWYSGSAESGSDTPQSKTSEVRLSSGEFDSKTHDYGWINYLEPFPLYDMPSGWFKLSDAISIMPLSVFCNIMGIVTEVTCLDEYYNDPNLKHKLVKDLPDKMQRLLKYKGRYKQSLCDIVSNLMCAGLLTPKQPLPNERLMTEIHFNRGAIVVDTSPSLPNFNQTQEPPGHKFSSKKFSFDVFSNVQSYWDEVMCVALNTPLGIRRANRIPRDRRWFKFKYCEAPVMLEDSIEPPPGDGKGACGLDTFLHAHICRNWSFSGMPTKFEITMQGLKSVSVKDIEPPAKKAKKTEKETPKKTKPKEANKPKPKSKSKRPTFEDMIIRPPKKPKGVGPPTRAPCFPNKKSQEQTTHNASNHLISVDDVDREAISKTVGLRKSFSAESDKILILCRIGLEIMKKTSYRNPYPFQDVRNIVHEYCEDAADKTAPNCQKRLVRLMKNPKNVTTINVCVAEYSSNQEFLGLDNPELPFSETFYTLVTRLIELSRTRVASLEDTSQLSSTLEELYERFYVQRIDLPGKVLSPSSDISVLGPPIQTVKDIRVAVARDVIQMACHSEQAKHNHIGVFKLFDELNMDEKEEAFMELQKTGLIIRRKDLASVTNLRRTLPFAPISVQLSYVYNQHFKPKGTQPSTFDESIKFLSQFNTPSGEPSQQARPTPIKLTEENVGSGDVACILSLLAVNKVTVEYHLPDEMLQTDEKQQDNFCTKKKSKLSSVLSKQKVVKKGEVSEGKVGNKPKPNIKKKARKTDKRKSESEKPGGAEDDKSEHSAESSEDGTKKTHTSNEKELGNEEADSKCGSELDDTSKLPGVRTTETKETMASESIQDSHGEDNSINKPVQKRNSTKDKGTENSTNTISSTLHEFIMPRPILKKKAKEKEIPKKGEVEIKHQEGTKEVIQENGASDNKEKQISTSQVKDKVRKQQTNEKARNTNDGTEEKSTDHVALEDPFVNNDSLTHCKFSTPIDLTPMDPKLFTPVLCSDSLSTRSFDIDKTAITKTVRRVGRMKGKGITAPTLLTNSSEIALVNNCSLFIRPKATSNSQRSVGDIGVSMDTEGSNQSLDILSPRSLDVILKNPPSLDAYLDDDNGFNASDRQLCTLILQAANEMKELGTSMELLKQMLREKKVVQDQASHSLEHHLSRLCDVNFLLQVGNFGRRYVCPSFARNWCIDFMKRKVMPEKVVEDTSLKPGDSQPEPPSTSSDPSASASVTEDPGPSSIEVATCEVVNTQPTAEPGASVAIPSTTFPAATEAVSEQPVASAETPTTVQAIEVVSEQPVASAETPTTVQAIEVVSEQPVASAETPTTVQVIEAVSEQPVASAETPTTVQAIEAVSEQPVASAETPPTTVQATEAVSEQPVVSAETPPTTVQATEAVSEQPVASAETPPTTVQATEAVSEQPVASAETPPTTVQAIEAVSEQPVASAETPPTTVQATEAVSEQPVESAETPPTTVQAIEAVSEQPVVSAETPPTTVQAIEVVSEQPVASAETPTTVQVIEAVSEQPVASAETPTTVQAIEAVSEQPVASAETPPTTVQATEAVSEQPVVSAETPPTTVQATEAVSEQPVASAETPPTTVQATEAVSEQPVASAETPPTTVQAIEAVSEQPVASAETPPTTVQATEAVSEQPVESAETPPTTVQAIEAVSEQPVVSAETPPTTVQAIEAVSEQPVASAETPPTTVQATEAVSEQPVASLPQSSAINQLVTTLAVTTTPVESPIATTSATTQTDKKKDPPTLTRPTQESEAILCRPWLEINGKVNKAFLKSIISAVLSDVMNNPGISEVHLAKKYANIIRPVYFTELLEYLLSIGCITKHTLYERKPSSLFSSPTVKQDPENITYYLPVVDCIVTLANAIKSCLDEYSKSHIHKNYLPIN